MEEESVIVTDVNHCLSLRIIPANIRGFSRNMRLFHESLSLLLGIFSVQMKANELEVNLALRRNATQSSTYGIWFAGNAVDGNPGVGKAWSTCSSTANQTSPWWRVDLLSVYLISRVVVTNRNDCCVDRIDGAEIRIGNSLENNGNDNPICAVISSIPAGVSSTYVCNNMEGRYVNLINPGESRYLNLCEVEVYGGGPGLKQTWVKLKLQSSFNLTDDDTLRDQILTQLGSALAQRGLSDLTLRWTRLPEQEVMRRAAEPAQCAQKK